MKVVHICTTLSGGTGLCAAHIINSTKALGIDVKAIVAYGERSKHADVVKSEYSWSNLRKTATFIVRSICIT